MSRKNQNHSDFYTYQNRMYNNNINLKDINSQKNFINDYIEKNHFNNIGQNYSLEKHGRNLTKKSDANSIIKSQAKYNPNNYSNNNQPNLNNISPNYNKYERDLGKNLNVDWKKKNQANYIQNNNQSNLNSISSNYKYSNDKILNYNLSKENHGRDLEKNFDKNRIIMNQANYNKNNYSNNNQPNRINISLNHNK